MANQIVFDALFAIIVKFILNMKFQIVALLLLLNSVPLLAAPLRFEGNTRACAGSVVNDVHQLHLTVRGLGERQSVIWSFEKVTRHDDQGHTLMLPRFWDGKNWMEKLALRANSNGALKLRILSGQTAEKPLLTARIGTKILGQIECDFGAPDMLRRFPEAGIEDTGQWAPPGDDSGYLFDYGLALNGKLENGKVYLKFRINAQRGDVDGNWRVVNGHDLKIRVAEVSFNENIFRSDGAKVTSLTTEKEIAPYFFIRNPNHPDARTRVVTTSRDGSANFTIMAGPKYDPQADNYLQHYIEAQDLSVYQPPAKPPYFQVAPVAAQGAPVEWTNAASQLRGQLLMGPQRASGKEKGKVISFDAKGRRETSFAIGKWSDGGFGVGAPFWAPNGARFGLIAFGTGNDYMMKFGLFDARTRAFIQDIAPPYTRWKDFAPDAQKLAFARGSRSVVGSSRIGDDYSLHVWNGQSEVKLPVNPSFLYYDDSEAMVCWRGSNELLVTQEVLDKTRSSYPQLSLSSVAADGKSAPRLLFKNAWKPLASPDGELVAFYGPESARQKPTQYYIAQPLDQSLCIARRDEKPMRDEKIGYADRLPLGRFGSVYPTLFWSADSKFLFAASAYVQGDKSFAEIWRFDARNGNRKRVAIWDFTVPARQFSNESNSYQWEFSGISRDGKTLFATFAQLENDPKDVFLLQTRQWFAVHLENGKIEKLATIRGTDFAWHSD